jgi:hypothetical protein
MLLLLGCENELGSGFGDKVVDELPCCKKRDETGEGAGGGLSRNSVQHLFSVVTMEVCEVSNNSFCGLTSIACV